MKNILPFLLLLISINGNAQSAVVLEPSVNYGTTGIISSGADYPTLGGSLKSAKAVPGYGCNLGIGSRFGHWQISSGVGYQRTGYSVSGTDQYSPYQTVNFKNTIYFNHILIPLTLSYRVDLTKRLSINPILGAIYSMNLSGVIISSENGTTSNNPMDKNMFANNYRRASGWWTGQVRLAYQISNRTSITLAPEYMMMIGDMLNDRGPYVAQRNYALTCAAGISWVVKYRGHTPH